MAPNIECELPRGRRAGGLRNRNEMIGTGPGRWRTDTMGLGGGRSAVLDPECSDRRELTPKPSRQ